MTLEELKFYGYRNRQKYLEENDHHAIQAFEQGVPMSQEIIAKKQQARDEMKLIKEAIELKDVEHLTIKFL